MQRYLDYNATCPPVREAIEAVARVAAEAPGNPSSLHWAGRAARRTIDDARDRLAAYIGAEPGCVVFTSGCTEADNIAIHSALSFCQPGRIVTTALEHPAVAQPLERFVEERGEDWQLVRVRPERNGLVSAEKMIETITPETRLVCMMMCNNETGAVLPVEPVAAHCRAHGIPMLIDAAQALGKLPFSFSELGVDFLTVSAHKIGGPKGVGALIVKRGVRINELTPGGSQERGRRSGTENVPGIAGFAAALGKVDFAACRPLRDEFEQLLSQAIPEAKIVAGEIERMPNTSLVLLPGMDGETLLMQLDLAGFAVASGSACSSGKREPSHVLLAMGISEQLARSSIRVSFGPDNSSADAEALVQELVKVYKRLKGMAGLTRMDFSTP